MRPKHGRLVLIDRMIRATIPSLVRMHPVHMSRVRSRPTVTTMRPSLATTTVTLIWPTTRPQILTTDMEAERLRLTAILLTLQHRRFHQCPNTVASLNYRSCHLAEVLAQRLVPISEDIHHYLCHHWVIKIQAVHSEWCQTIRGTRWWPTLICLAEVQDRRSALPRHLEQHSGPCQVSPLQPVQIRSWVQVWIPTQRMTTLSMHFEITLVPKTWWQSRRSKLLFDVQWGLNVFISFSGLLVKPSWPSSRRRISPPVRTSWISPSTTYSLNPRRLAISRISIAFLHHLGHWYRRQKHSFPHSLILQPGLHKHPHSLYMAVISL